MTNKVSGVRYVSEKKFLGDTLHTPWGYIIMSLPQQTTLVWKGEPYGED